MAHFGCEPLMILQKMQVARDLETSQIRLSRHPYPRKHAVVYLAAAMVEKASESLRILKGSEFKFNRDSDSRTEIYFPIWNDRQPESIKPPFFNLEVHLVIYGRDGIFTGGS